VQSGNLKSSAVKRVLKINKESEEEEKINAHQLLNVEVDFLEIVTTEDLPAKCPRQHASIYEASSVS
jgi:hypothetical protein